MFSIPSAGARETAGHAVQFYEDDAFLVTVVADFLAEGLGMGRSCLVIATPEHRRGIAAALARSRPVDAAGVIYCDARECLARFMTGGRADEARFEASVGRMVAEVAARRPDRVVYAFGEMVNVLCADRMAGAALELEGLWNDLLTRLPVSLLCAYRTGVLASGDGGATFDQVCTCHRDVRPTQRLTAESDDASRLRHVARLEHRVRDFDPASAGGREVPALIGADVAARTRFVSAASHELRNPIHVLRLQLRAAVCSLDMADGADLVALREWLRRADAQAVRLSEILDDVLSVRDSES